MAAPVVQGILVGLGAVAVGLVFFPYGVAPIRGPGQPLTPYVRRERFVRFGRVLSWCLAALVPASLAGYTVIFVQARGKFCDAVLGEPTKHLICVWVAVLILTVVLAVVAAGLRRWARRTTGE
ncbi:MAG TPA: hypothetical protein VGD67_22355 [Pseudonocardiaceae bacterium]